MNELIRYDQFKADVNNYPIKPADIILYKSKIKKGYTWVQNEVQGSWDTEFELNHVGLGFFPIQAPITGKVIHTVYEAKASMAVTNWQDVVNSPNTDFEVWRFISPFNMILPRALERGLLEVYEKTNWQNYGYAQILYFGLEALVTRNKLAEFIWEQLGGGDIKKMKNWFPEGQICSELAYRLIKAVQMLMGWNDVALYLDKWNPDNISPIGVKMILRKFQGTRFIRVHHRIIV